MAVVALEEVLDRKEQWRRGRHSGDYWVSVYGEPQGDQPWSWRLLRAFPGFSRGG